MVTAERLQLWLSLTLRGVMAVAGAWAAVQGQWMVAFLSAMALVFSFIPTILERNLKIYLPAELEITMLVFLFASVFLGNAHGAYTRFWWWDGVLHTASGVILGFVGFLLIYVLNREPKIQLKMGPGFVALFTFAFAVMIGALWEIFEFSMDMTIGTNMQRSGLVDTMWDLIVDSLGALFAAAVGYLYVKAGRGLIDPLVKKFLRENKEYFAK